MQINLYNKSSSLIHDNLLDDKQDFKLSDYQIPENILNKLVKKLNHNKKIIILAGDHHSYKTKKYLINKFKKDYNLLEIKNYNLEQDNKPVDYTRVTIMACELYISLVNYYKNDLTYFSYENFDLNNIKTNKADEDFIFLILMCNNANGVNIVANKYKGINSAICNSISSAKKARLHGNCKTLCLSVNKKLSYKQYKNYFIIKTFLKTKYKNKYDNRLNHIKLLEEYSFHL